MKILDVAAVAGKSISLDDYTHILAYHACRAEDEQTYRLYGLKPFTQEEALEAAIQKLECDRIDKNKIEAKFYPLWQKAQSPCPSCVWLMLETRELLGESGHYLIYGSEFLNALADNLGCRERLSEIGKPMIIKCRIPITDIGSCWLNNLEEAIKERDTACRSIAVASVDPENIVDITYPTGYVSDPYCYPRRFKLG